MKCDERSLRCFEDADRTILFEEAPEEGPDSIYRYNLNVGRNSDAKTFYYFLDHFAPALVGVKAWKSKQGKERFDKLLTRSDEAFLLTVIDGNFRRWDYENSHPGCIEDDKPVHNAT